MKCFLHDGKVLIRFIAETAGLVEGSFRFNDVLQICSLPDDAPRPERSIANMDYHPFIIEYSFDEMDIETLRKVRTEGLSSSSDIPDDAILVTDHYRSKQQEILSVLSVITQNLVTSGSSTTHWVRESDKSIQPGSFSDSLHFFEEYNLLGVWFSAQDSREISVVNSSTYYKHTGYIGGNFALADTTTSLLETYFGLENDTKEAFLSACVLFTKAIQAKSVSVSLTYIGIVSSLEALIEFEHRGESTSYCSKCHQPTFKVRKKFREFVAKYAPGDTKTRKFANDLYDRRSGIGHRGELLAHDVVGRVVPPSVETQDYSELYNMTRVARICFVNWLATRPLSATDLKEDTPKIWDWIDALGRNLERLGSWIQALVWRRITARVRN